MTKEKVISYAGYEMQYYVHRHTYRFVKLFFFLCTQGKPELIFLVKSQNRKSSRLQYLLGLVGEAEKVKIGP